jgi:hypothetical protein
VKQYNLLAARMNSQTMDSPLVLDAQLVAIWKTFPTLPKLWRTVEERWNYWVTGR